MGSSTFSENKRFEASLRQPFPPFSLHELWLWTTANKTGAFQVWITTPLISNETLALALYPRQPFSRRLHLTWDSNLIPFSYRQGNHLGGLRQGLLSSDGELAKLHEAKSSRRSGAYTYLPTALHLPPHTKLSRSFLQPSPLSQSLRRNSLLGWAPSVPQRHLMARPRTAVCKSIPRLMENQQAILPPRWRS
jgi:hypothetical protein